MLTTDDLKTIRKIIREEIENEVKVAKLDLDAEIRRSRMLVQEDIGELKDRIKNLEIQLRKDDGDDTLLDTV